MPGMTDQQQRDMEAQFRAELAAVRRERDALRARLESAEAALRDAQESRFALIVENEELGAELAATRARLESAEAALRRLANPDASLHDVGQMSKFAECALSALGAAGEEGSG